MLLANKWFHCTGIWFKYPNLKTVWESCKIQNQADALQFKWYVREDCSWCKHTFMFLHAQYTDCRKICWWTRWRASEFLSQQGNCDWSKWQCHTSHWDFPDIIHVIHAYVTRIGLASLLTLLNSCATVWLYSYLDLYCHMFLSTCVILSLRGCLAKWHFSPHLKHVILLLSCALVTTGFTHASLFFIAKHALIKWPTFSQEPHLGKFLLCPTRRRLWSDVSQMFDQGVDTTSLFRRGDEGEERAIRWNFHRLQMIVFNSK